MFAQLFYSDTDDIASKKQENIQKLEIKDAELRKQVALLTQKEKCDTKETDVSSKPVRNKDCERGDCSIASTVNP